MIYHLKKTSLPIRNIPLDPIPPSFYGILEANKSEKRKTIPCELLPKLLEHHPIEFLNI